MSAPTILPTVSLRPLRRPGRLPLVISVAAMSAVAVFALQARSALPPGGGGHAAAAAAESAAEPVTGAAVPEPAPVLPAARSGTSVTVNGHSVSMPDSGSYSAVLRDGDATATVDIRTRSGGSVSADVTIRSSSSTSSDATNEQEGGDAQHVSPLRR